MDHLLGDAATEQSHGAAGQSHQPAAHEEELTLQALEVRFDIMTSGQTGTPILSGMSVVAIEPTYGLVSNVIKVINLNKYNVLFDMFEAHRPCGVFDRYEAQGMLLGDLLRGVLLERGIGCTAHKVGKAMAKMPSEIPGGQAKAKKAAKSERAMMQRRPLPACCGES